MDNLFEKAGAEEEDLDSEAPPSLRAVIIAVAILCISGAVLAIAAFELSQSKVWRAAPGILQRALR